MVMEEELKEEEEWKPNDDMTELAWFGPEDSDEEIEEIKRSIISKLWRLFVLIGWMVFTFT